VPGDGDVIGGCAPLNIDLPWWTGRGRHTGRHRWREGVRDCRRGCGRGCGASGVVACCIEGVDRVAVCGRRHDGCVRERGHGACCRRQWGSIAVHGRFTWGADVLAFATSPVGTVGGEVSPPVAVSVVSRTMLYGLPMPD